MLLFDYVIGDAHGYTAYEEDPTCGKGLECKVTTLGRKDLCELLDGLHTKRIVILNSFFHYIV